MFGIDLYHMYLGHDKSTPHAWLAERSPAVHGNVGADSS